MNQPPSSPGTRFRVLALGLLGFVLLTVRFSTDWIEFYRGYQDMLVHAPSEAARKEITKSFEDSIAVLRGFYVAKQVENLAAAIDSPNHKIVRWRLLMPTIGHFLNLPRWFVLGLAPIGCLALVLLFVDLGYRWSSRPGETNRSSDAICLGLVAGASAPFFTSMGWLGYYDSWLALALIGVSFVQSRWLVILACLLGPWVDERFVIGLPLALCVRYRYFAVQPTSRTNWLKREAIAPLALALCYSLFRLSVAGSGSSQTVGDYWRDFVLAADISVSRRIYGAWEGLRLGWIAVGFVGLGRFWVATALTLATAAVGLLTAQDVGRSVVLIIPVMLFGWHQAAQTAAWQKYRLAVVLGAMALLMPATHVTGNISLPVDSLWSAPHELLGIQNDIGLMYLNGDRLPKNLVEAERIFRTLAGRQNAEAQNNLGLMYADGKGVPQSSTEAAAWYRKAAESGNASAQSNLGVAYATGNGVAPDIAEAKKWYRKAANQGNVVAQFNLAVVLAEASSKPDDLFEAAKWYRKAAEQGHAGAQNNLGMMYANGSGLPKDFVQAYFWFSFANANGNADAKDNLATIAHEMTPGQIAAASSLIKSNAGRYRTTKKP